MSDKVATVTTGPKKSTPKKPSDRKAKNQPPSRPQDTLGWHLMKPMDEIPVWDQMPLIAMLHDALDDSEVDEMSTEEFANLTPEERKAKIDEAGESRNFDITVLGKLAFELKKFAVNEEEYVKFCSGSGALERSLNLAMAWVGQMGEFSSSDA